MLYYYYKAKKEVNDMSKHDTPITTLQRIIRNTNTKHTLTKTKVLEKNEYNNLLTYIINNTTVNNTLNYT